MSRIPLEPPFTADDIPQLDALHEALGFDFGQLWLESDQRAKLLGHKMIDSLVGHECSICWACVCHGKEILQKPCPGLQLKKKEQE